MDMELERVRALVLSQKIVMSDLKSRRLSKSQVIIEIPSSKSISLITLPDALENEPILHVLLNAFTLSWYAVRLGRKAKYSYNNTVIGFIKFLAKKKSSYRSSGDGNLPLNCFADWFQYLSVRSSNVVIYLHLTKIFRLLTASLEDEYTKQSDWPPYLRAAWDNLRNLIPHPPKNRKKPPLGIHLGIPETEYTNKELLMGLRYGVIWLLEVLSRQRKLFLENEVVAQAVAGLRGVNLNSFKQSFSNFNEIQSKSERGKSFKDLRPIASSVLNIIKGDTLLTELQFYSFPKIQEKWRASGKQLTPMFRPSLQSFLLSRCFDASGEARSRTLRCEDDTQWDTLRPFLGSPNGPIPQPYWWGKAWVIHTPLEKLLMVWLLASERAQPSGIEKLTVEGITISRDRLTLQIQTAKMRRFRNGNPMYVGSTIYKRREPPFRIYSKWIDAVNDSSEFLKGYNPKRKLLFNAGSAIEGLVSFRGRVSPNQLLPLELIATNGSAWQGRFLEDAAETGKTEARAFIAILQSRFPVLSSNPNNRLGIPISAIGQSLVVEHERESNSSFNHSESVVDVMGHSSGTGKNIYKDGFRAIGVAELIEPVQAFARKIGDEKFSLAQRTAQIMFDRSRKVSLTELQKICGIHTPNTDQHELLSKLDEADMLTIAGELNYGNEVLIIQNELTATMMSAYINHIERSLPALVSSDRTEFGIRHLARLIYLHQVFDKFPKNLQRKGRKNSLLLNFSFPPLA